MGIGSIALKALKLIPKYAFSDGASKIGKARRATVASNSKSIFGKGNEFALKNFKKKAETGWNYLKKDALKTMNSSKGVWASICSFGKSLISKPKAGIRLAKIAAAKAGKTASLWAKAGGALKGVGAALKKLPIVGTLLVVGFEAYESYGAFSRGGAWEGTKQVLKSAAKIAGFAVGTALGAVVGGPVGALVGGLAGDMLVGWITGGSYSENHPEPEDEEAEASSKTEEISSQGDQAETESTSESLSTPTASSDSSTSASTETTGVTPSVATPYPTLTGMTNPFGAGLSVPNPAMIGMNNPFGMGLGMSNPYMGAMGYDPTQALVNSLLQPGENIFLKYPMGYQFQYIG